MENMLKGNKLKQEYRTLSFVYFDTHQLIMENRIKNSNFVPSLSLT